MGHRQRPTLNAVDKYLLDIASEDYSHLCEATIAHRQASPDLDEAELIRLAQATLRKLFKKGYIEFYFYNREDPRCGERLERTPSEEEIREALATLEYWQIPTSGPFRDRGYAFVTTPAGEAVCCGPSG